MQSMKALWSRYLTLLQTRPVLTNTVTSGAIAFSGDLIAQYLEQKPRIHPDTTKSQSDVASLESSNREGEKSKGFEWDFRRSLAIVIWSAGVVAPVRLSS